jgi:asparagine synthase (glutamine-hydrolysing)
MALEPQPVFGIPVNNMCGVVGILAYHNAAPPIDREEIVRIRQAMRSRGPDGAGLWVSADERVALAHRRLSIIDLIDAGPPR